MKIYVMGSTQVDFLDIVHVKVGFFAVLKMCVRARLGKFVWSTLFVQCAKLMYVSLAIRVDFKLSTFCLI